METQPLIEKDKWCEPGQSAGTKVAVGLAGTMVKGRGSQGSGGVGFILPWALGCGTG